MQRNRRLRKSAVAPRRRHDGRRGFSLVELLVLVGILVILVSIFLPYVSMVRETNRRTRCAENLRTIGLAFTEYTKTNSSAYPRVRAAIVPAAAPSTAPAATQPTTNPVTLGPEALAPSVSPTPAPPATSPSAVGPAPAVATTAPSTAPSAPAPPPAPAVPAAPPPAPVPEVVVAGYAAFTGGDSTNPFAPDSRVQPNDVTASLWLLARVGLVEPYRFVCPSTGDTPDPMSTDGRRVTADQRSNFTGGRHLSYSYCSPFSASPRFRLNSDVLPPDFALLADKSPGIGGRKSDVTAPTYDARPLEIARANSTNHDRAGQNVLYPTGTVQFQKTPYCGYGNGWQRDNIFTTLSRQPLPPGANPAPEAKGYLGGDIGPAWEKDSYLVPTEGQ